MLKPGQTGGGGGGCPFEYRTWISLYRQKPTNISIPHKGKKSATHQLCPYPNLFRDNRNYSVYQHFRFRAPVIVFLKTSLTAVVIWLKYCWYGGKHYPIKQKILLCYLPSQAIRGGRVLSTNANDLRSFNRLWRSTAKRSATVDDLKNWCPVSQ